MRARRTRDSSFVFLFRCLLAVVVRSNFGLSVAVKCGARLVHVGRVRNHVHTRVTTINIDRSFVVDIDSLIRENPETDDSIISRRSFKVPLLNIYSSIRKFAYRFGVIRILDNFVGPVKVQGSILGITP